jgi:hypothetical protein
MTTDKTYNKKGDKVVSLETKGNKKKLITCVYPLSYSKGVGTKILKTDIKT